MNKKGFLFLVLVVFPFLVYPQVDVKVGEPYEVVNGSKYYFSRGAEIMTVKVRNEKIVIQKFDTLSLTEKSKTVYDDLPKYAHFEAIKELNNQVYLFYALWNGKEQKDQLFAREISFSEGKFIGPGQLIVEEEEEIIGGYNHGRLKFWVSKKYFISSKFLIYTSSDNSHLLVKYQLKRESVINSINQDRMGFHVFGKDLAKIWSKKVRMPYTESNMEILDKIIDSKGNCYMLISVKEDKKVEDNQPGFHLELLKIGAGSGVFSKTTVETRNKFFEDIYIKEANNGDIICAGYYKPKEISQKVEGIFVSRINKQGKTIFSKVYDIPGDLLKFYETKKSKKEEEKGDIGVKCLVLKNVIVQNDGSIILISQQEYFIDHSITYHNDNDTYVNIDYYYDDLFVSKYDATGNQLWLKRLPKKQVGKYMLGEKSYKYFYEKGALYIFFLDNIENLNLALNEEHKYFNEQGEESHITAYKVRESDGFAEKISLLNRKEVQGIPIYQFSIDKILPISENEFILEMYKKEKEDILIKVSY